MNTRVLVRARRWSGFFPGEKRVSSIFEPFLHNVHIKHQMKIIHEGKGRSSSILSFLPAGKIQVQTANEIEFCRTHCSLLVVQYIVLVLAGTEPRGSVKQSHLSRFSESQTIFTALAYIQHVRSTYSRTPCERIGFPRRCEPVPAVAAAIFFCFKPPIATFLLRESL
jgi:hypothetical protein